MVEDFTNTEQNEENMQAPMAENQPLQAEEPMPQTAEVMTEGPAETPVTEPSVSKMPSAEAPQVKAEPVRRFDPMSGQPLYPQGEQTVYTVRGPEYFSYPQPAVQKPAKEKKPPKPLTAGKVVAICTAICLAFAILLTAGYCFFLRPSGARSTVVLQKSDAPISDQTSASGSMDVKAVAAVASPSVVEISTEAVTTGTFMRQYITQGAGSGVIISTDGYIVTNNHVISGATSILATTADGKKYDAELIGTDAETDIAVIKIAATGLTPAVLGDSDALSVGDPCVVIGNPLGSLGGTVTDGIISALDREVTIDDTTMRLLQTNAAVNPGNSGGGMFNKNGELVAIINAKSSGSGIEGLGFAIPINAAQPVMEDLLTYGYVKGRPFVGIAPVEINDARTAKYYGVSEYGVYVLKIVSGSPASKTDLQGGDRIVSFNGKTITTTTDLTDAINACKVGQKVDIVIARSFGEKTIQIVLGESTPDNN